MRTVCNKKWQTTDSDKALYQEILFQWCCSQTTKPELQHLKDKYGDRLRLPLVLWKHHPLRFSIAHRTHGFGMATGWISECPVNVQERIINDELNNMLVESWYVNSSKLDMAEEYYNQLDELLCAVDITDPTIYNHGIPRTSGHVVLSTTEADVVVDEFEGAGFDDSAFSFIDE